MDKKNNEQLVEKAEKFLKYETDKVVTWCSNCGNYGIQNALLRALVLEGYERNDFMLCFDIGCNGNGSDKFEANTIHGLHGRVLPLAAGAALANGRMKVIAMAGDGATFSEGVNHLVHAVRNDFPVMFIHYNNENYGLTIGQASALTRCGAKMSGTPGEVVVPPINPLRFVLGLDPTFVARSFSGDVDQMTEIFREALKHKGFAYVEILQACPTYNKATPESWYAERVVDVASVEGYDVRDIWAARRLVEDMDEKIHTGILYRSDRPNFVESYPFRKGVRTELVDEVAHVDISGLI